jgi:peptidoglycan/LPS O-acetylase OafA/YrhL
MLHHLPYAWYFVGSLPMWVGLWAASRWASHQRATTLALIGYRVLVVAMMSVAAWSVAQGQPDWVAMATALLVMVGAFAAPCVLPTPLFRRHQAESIEEGGTLSCAPYTSS